MDENSITTNNKCSPFWKWPSRSHWRCVLNCSCILTLIWIIIYAGADWITNLHEFRISLNFDWESKIPFFPVSTIFYLSLFPLLWLAPFLLHTKKELYSFTRSIAVTILLAGLFFLLLPVRVDYSHPSTTGFLHRLFVFADAINLEHNNFPSLHVGMAISCALIYQDQVTHFAKAFIWMWAVLICLSTLFMHQHHIVDIAGGVILAFVGFSFYKANNSTKTNGAEIN